MSNKSRVVQSTIKIEKEYENIELRKRMKSLSKDKYWSYKKENVWDRLSKVQKTPSIENRVEAIKSRPNITSAPQRSKMIKQIVINQSEYPTKLRKPLSPNSVSANKHLDVPKKLRTQVATQTFAYSKNPIKSVEEILTVRSLSNSKSSSDDKRAKRYEKKSKSPRLTQRSNLYIQGNTRAQINKDNTSKCDESSEDSNEEYKLAPLMISPSQQSTDSMKIVKNLNEFLCYKEISFSSEDISLVKDVIKSDKRYKNLDKNPKLCKEILETQLQKILKHELVVKNALESLEPSPNMQQQQSNIMEIDKPVNEIVSYSNFNRNTQKLEVDVVFKNVPSLETEIAILRALGEKLEATLKSTSSQREKFATSSRGFITADTETILKNEPKCVPVYYDIEYEKCISYCEKIVEYSAQTIGVRHIFGTVEEFYMAEKTIFELKQEAKRSFYVPVCTDAVELKRTSFERLMSNPDEFFRYIKPKNCETAFNLLEQDSRFFNSLFHKSPKPTNFSIDLSANEYLYEEKQLTTAQTLCEGGDSEIWKKKICKKRFNSNEKNTQMMPINTKNKNNLDSELKKPPTLLEPIIRGKQRRRIRQHITPMPMNSYCNPKNSLLKTVLVGFVQMSVFIIFIMALTYPDLIC